jgi:hypothetical protein
VAQGLTKAERTQVDREFAYQTLGNKCGWPECEIQDRSLLDFHHHGKKENNVTKLFGRCYRKRLIAELNKCVLLCANHHRKFHIHLKETEL